MALNCVANGLLLRENLFDDIWIQPAAGDAGGALGAALAAWHLDEGAPRRPVAPDAMAGAYLGPVFSDAAAAADFDRIGARYRRLDEAAMLDETAAALAEGQAVGWMQGRMEFGPRALGGRSILADPRSPAMQRQLNLKVKYRESFRPFAPAILAEHLGDWFDLDRPSPYMLLVADVVADKRRTLSDDERGKTGLDRLAIPRSAIPAVTHVDDSARIQTVHAETNPRYHAVLARFHALTGCPVLVNTSFNVRGEPIVCTPEDAFRCFMGTELDLLVVGTLILRKADQDPALRENYETKYELD